MQSLEEVDALLIERPSRLLAVRRSALTCSAGNRFLKIGVCIPNVYMISKMLLFLSLRGPRTINKKLKTWDLQERLLISLSVEVKHRIEFIFNYVGSVAFLHQTTLQRMLCSIAELDGITSCCF